MHLYTVKIALKCKIGLHPMYNFNIVVIETFWVWNGKFFLMSFSVFIYF